MLFKHSYRTPSLHLPATPRPEPPESVCTNWPRSRGNGPAVRNLAKLKSGYTDALPGCIDPNTGRVHTSYQQAVAATGRLSSINPNLQNIPARTGEGRRIRQAFVAPEGRVLISADYSQIELRIMAQLSGDEGLRRAFSEDMDVHRATAAEVFGTPPDSVSADQRRAAKAINFGLIYGMSPFGLADSSA